MRRGRLILIVAGAVLFTYNAGLLATTLLAQRELRQATAHQVRSDLEQRAASLQYFLSERQDDLRELQVHPSMRLFFATESRGASAGEELVSCLLEVGDVFSEVIAAKTLGGKRVIQHLALLVDGEVRAESGAPARLPTTETLGPERVWVHGDEGVEQLVLAQPIDQQPTATLVAWLDLDAAFHAFAASAGTDLDGALYLVHEGRIVAASDFAHMPELPADLVHSTEQPFVVGLEPWSNRITVQVPVAGTPLRLVGVVEMDVLLGAVGSDVFLVTLIVLTLVVVAIVLLLFKLSMSRMVLAARIAESQKRQLALDQQNRQLEREIAKRMEYEELLMMHGNYDSLTRLPNRSLAVDRLYQATAMATAHGEIFAVMLIDLDRFKNVNETFGHAAGDRLLQEAAERLASLVGPGDTVARLGGDEFLMLMPDLESGQPAMRIADDIVARFEAPFRIEGCEVIVTASVGVALFPDDGEEPQTLLKHADTALHDIKDNGKNDYRFFAPALNEQARARLLIESELLGALERDEFSLVFQPIFDLGTGECVGAEALLRWSNRQLGHLSPGRFIPIAEDAGLIEALGAWALRRACAEAAGWQVTRRHTVAVNVSSRQLRVPTRFLRLVEAVLEETGLPPAALELEITEGILLADVSDISKMLDELARLGVRLVIDDFGTGYSALSYLRKFPFNKLKIDQSFVRQMTEHGHEEIVIAIIAMAAALRLDVLGEGVERQEQADFLKANGCQFAQGYFLSRPLSSARFAEIIV